MDEDLELYYELLLIGLEFVDYKDRLTYLENINREINEYKEELKEKELVKNYEKTRFFI